MNSPLNIQVSCFKDCLTADGPREVNLLAWLTSDKYRPAVERIRATTDKDKRSELKLTLPAITPSGTFTYRNVAGLVSHSGLITFDVDFAGNKHITNYSALKEQLGKVQNIAYVGLSVSGTGFWGLIPITNPSKHKEHFAALCQDFQRLGITLDTNGGDVCRLRIYSFDPDGIFNHEAKPYSKTFTPKPKAAPAYFAPSEGDNAGKVDKIVNEITRHKIDITSDYEDWFRIACGLANELGAAARSAFHQISQFHPKYDPAETDKLFDNCLNNNYSDISLSSLFYVADTYGIRYKEAGNGPVVVTTYTPEDLAELAVKHIGANNHLSGDELLSRVGVEVFTRMIDGQLISRADPLVNEYYLTDSNPY